MKISPDFILREIAGEYILVSTAGASGPKSILYLNDIGCRVYRAIKDGTDMNTLKDQLLEEYDVAETILREDMTQFVVAMRQLGAITD